MYVVLPLGLGDGLDMAGEEGRGSGRAGPKAKLMRGAAEPGAL